MNEGVAWFHNTLGGNEIWRFLAWLLAVLVAAMAGRVARHYMRKFAEVLDGRNRPLGASVLAATGKSLVFALVVIAVKSGLHFLVLSPAVASFAMTATNVLVVVATSFVLYCLVDVVSGALMRAAEKTPSKLDDMLAPMVRSSLRITVVVLGLVQVATVLSDKPLTSIMAGLGVGGLAVALAAQETIKNFFGSVTVLTDKPFELGDRVMVDKYDGVVEHVGFRSTRLRTLDGDLVTIPNGALAGMGILNAGKRPHLRRVMTIGITCDTPPEKVQLAVELIKGILENHPRLDPKLPPRVHFKDFGASSLDISVAYWYGNPDNVEFMDFSHWVNLEILRKFSAEGIQMAFPTRTVHLLGDRRGSLAKSA
jgi:MscS family membrane protein